MLKMIVCFNVGGYLYIILKLILNNYILIVLMDILKNCDEDGNVFIDCDGKMFYYIFGFLRIGEFCLFDDFFDFVFLFNEVIFFDIFDLILFFERVKCKKLLFLFVFKYIEILEIKKDGYIKIVLKGRK